MYQFEEFKINNISKNTSGKKWGKFTDQLIIIEQDRDKITLGEKELKIIEKSNMEKQADLVEETAFENLKVKEPITYTEEELKSKLKTLLNEYISYPENFITGVCLDSSKFNHWFERNRKK
jgi:hypothetical protein